MVIDSRQKIFVMNMQLRRCFTRAMPFRQKKSQKKLDFVWLFFIFKTTRALKKFKIWLHKSQLAALPAKMSAFNIHMRINYGNLKWTLDLLSCYCCKKTTDSRTVWSHFSNLPLQAKERTWLNCKLINAWHQNCEPCAVWVSCRQIKSLQE